jgi:hypothetical protein
LGIKIAMNKTLRLALVYLSVAIALASIDIVYEYSSPLVSESGETTEWHGEVGLRAGAIFLSNYEGPATGLIAEVHIPKFVPFPFFAGAGPEGGGIFIMVWFVAVLAFGIHLLLRSRPRPRTTETQSSGK